MGMQIQAEKKLVWCNERNSMLVKTEVFVRVVGNKGTIYMEEGPLFCETAQEVFFAVHHLKNRIFKKLPPNPDTPPAEHII